MVDRLLIYTTPENQVSPPGPGVLQIQALRPDQSGGQTWVEYVANIYSIAGFRFVPLVRKENNFTCSLDILFLRRGHPGEIVTQGGDIDNRVKVLFDSLKMPANYDQVQAAPGDGENPFYCLLEDDSLITSVAVTTDRLLTPAGSGESESEVEMVVHVTVKNPGALFGDYGLV